MSARAALDNTQGCVLEAEAPELLLRPFGPSNIVPLPLSRPGTAELDHAVLAHQLDVAHRIQQSLLPRTFPALPGFDLAGFCHSAHQVGGDYYDVLPLSRDLLLVAIDRFYIGIDDQLSMITIDNERCLGLNGENGFT